MIIFLHGFLWNPLYNMYYLLLQIDSLKTKIVELEKQYGGGDTRLHQGDLQSSHKISPLFFCLYV